jgi:hypothetical protein
LSADPEINKVVAESAKTAADYWSVLHRILPIAFVGGFVGLVTNLVRVAHEKTWTGKALACVSVVAVGCVAAGVSALGIGLFLTDAPIDIDLVVASIGGASGQKMLDIYARRIFGFQNTRATDRQPPPVMFSNVPEDAERKDDRRREGEGGQ